MSKKVKNMNEINKQIENIDTKMKIINKELNQIKKMNEILILNIQEIIVRTHLT